MTDQIHDTDVEPTTQERSGIHRRRMLLAGAGLAGAAVAARAGTAGAADDDPVLTGNPDNETDDGATVVTNTNATDTDPGTDGQEAIVGVLTGTGNGSAAVRGQTAGGGHAVAGVVPTDNVDNAVAATSGRHDGGGGAGVGGVNGAADVELDGPARGVEGIVTEATNGSAAVYGETMGAGHAVAGDTPAEAEDGAGGPNTAAATWGRHGGAGAGVGGESAEGYGGEFVGGKAHVRLVQSVDETNVGPPTGDGHLLGELYVDGAGDLWFNRADGENFSKLTGQGGGVALLPDPQRAYDSREEEPPENAEKGRFDRFTVREIDLTEFTDFDPAAQGAVVNITIDDPESDGFATVFNGDTADDDRPLTSTINFWAGSLSIANGVIVATSAAGTIKVYTHEPCEVIIDLIGSIT